MCGSSPDLRPLLASHALDDVRGCSSDDETCSVVSDRSPLQSPLSPPSAGGDEADLLAFVSSTDQRASARKYSTAISKRSKPPSRPIAVQNTANVSTVPVKPLKWQLRLADRATAGVNLEAHYQIPPNVLFDLLADPMQHERIFDEIEAADAELLEDDGVLKKWRLDYSARWSFWKVSGVCENRLWMWTDRNAGTVTFKLREPGFLRRYEGTWTIKPACGTPMSACYAPADAVAAASVTTSPSSSRYTSPCSSASSSPRATAVPAGTGSSSPASWWGSYRTGSSGGSTHGLDLASASPGGMVVSPLASVSIMDAGAGLKGAVAAIARMQAAFTQSVTNSASNFGTLANSISSSGLPAFTQLPQLLPCPISPATGPVSRAQEQDEPPRQRYWDPSLIPTSSIISAETLTSPKVTPPYPLNALLKNQSKGQVDDMLQGLVRAAVAHLQTQPLQGV